MYQAYLFDSSQLVSTEKVKNQSMAGESGNENGHIIDNLWIAFFWISKDRMVAEW